MLIHFTPDNYILSVIEHIYPMAFRVVAGGVISVLKL